MRRSPRRPLILRRRKLPFQQNDLLESSASGSKDPSGSAASQSFPDGICILDHPSMSDTQVVVVPKTVDLQGVIGALTAKGKESGVQGPNKFILLSGSGGSESGSLCQPAAEGEGASLPITLPFFFTFSVNKDLDCGPLNDSLTNIQWLGKMNTSALEPDPAKEMTNKENQNSNSQVSFPPDTVKQPVTERPPYSYMAMIQFAINSRKDKRMTLKEIYTWIEDNFPYFRQVAKPGWKNSIRHNLSLHDMFIRETSADNKISFWTIRPEDNRCLTLDQVYKQQKKVVPDSRKTPSGSESKVMVKVEPVCVPIKCETPKCLPKRQARSSRRKQHLVHSRQEEPVLLCSDSSLFDSGVGFDASAFQEMRDMEPDEHQQESHSPNQEFSFKTPIKSRSHLTSSTPSKPPSNILAEPWKVTPVHKESQNLLDCSPIHTPGGPAVTPLHDYTNFSFSSTPFKDVPLFNSPRELCSRELLQGLVLDTMNDSLSKILVDISFSGLDDEDLGMTNISWSDFIP
uniref:Forkhead box protein M1 n=1 Tax=Mola mola TaxID=94237 RepID=A0A3Q4AAY4_MOLML